MHLTDVATAEQMVRIIQSIPSPKAEPFKMWMAKVAAERIDQLQDPVAHKYVAASGGNVAKVARLELEKKTGRSVLLPLNASDAGALDVDEQGLMPE